MLDAVVNLSIPLASIQRPNVRRNINDLGFIVQVGDHFPEALNILLRLDGPNVMEYQISTVPGALNGN